MRYLVMQVHTPTGNRNNWGIEFDPEVAVRAALDLNDPQRHLVGVVEPMGEQESFAELRVAA
jgi:hypothetical protein